MLKEYEDKQAALNAQRQAEERRRAELEAQQQREFEQRQLQQAEAQRIAQEQLMQQQMYNNNQQSQLEQELLAMRGQYERDQIFLEQYDRVSDESVGYPRMISNLFCSVSKLWRLSSVASTPMSTVNWGQRTSLSNNYKIK